MIGRPGERDSTEEACAAERWLEPDAAAERRRNADAAPGVAAECGVRLAGDDGHCRPARGAARDLCRVPWIAHVAEMRVDRTDAVRELVHSELAEEHRAPLSHLPHDRDRKSTRLNSSHSQISYAVFCLKKKKNICTQ